MELDEESQLIATINTHVGLFRAKRVFYGIASGPAMCQRAIEETFSGIPSTVSFQDDALLTGADDTQHLQTLDTVLERFENAGLRLRSDKCVFLQEKVEYLGHVITIDGIYPLPQKIDAIVNAPIPTDVKQLRSFLGLLNYYGKFVPDLSQLLHPLHLLLQADTAWKWTPSQQESFDKEKNAISSAPVLTHYDPALPIEVYADSSSYGLGAVLVHAKPNGSKKPVAFASRTLTKTEQGYAQIDKEALGVCFAVKKFHQYLFGRSFLIWTDHQPLTTLFNPKSSIPSTLSPRKQRYVIFLMGYNYTIKYVKTTDNAVADMLSRLPLKTVEPVDTTPDEPDCLSISVLSNLPVTTTQLRSCTRRDPLLSAVLRLTRE